MKRHPCIVILAAFAAFICAAPIAASTRPIVTNITAEIGSNGSIVLSWAMPALNGIEEILVFSSPVPVTAFEQIQSISPKVSLPPLLYPESTAEQHKDCPRTSWVDKTPIKSGGFYAVVLVTGGKRFPLIIPSVNATVKSIAPARVARRAHTEHEEHTISGEADDDIEVPAVRPIPLPNTKARHDERDEEAVSQARSLSLQGIAGEERDVLFPYVFKEDIVAPESGEEVFLFDILKSTFIKEKYTECAASLIRLLRTNMSRQVTTRAMFYLGECYYFCKEYGKAVTEFLKVKDYCALASISSEALDAMPKGSYERDAADISYLCSRWIDSSLNFMANSPSSF